MDNKLNKILVSLLVVILIITLTVGLTYAYLLADDSKDITVKTASGINTSLSLEVIKSSSSLVPIVDSKISTAIKKSSDKCVDKNGYEVCSLYRVVLSNTSTSEDVYGYVRTISSSYVTSNLRYQVFDSSFNAISDVMTISNTAGDIVYFNYNNSKKVFSSNGNITFYFVVWLTDTSTSQDSDYDKLFNGAVGIELFGSNSDRLEASF